MKSPFQLPPDLSINSSPKRALSIMRRIWGGRGVFTCTIGNTLTSTIPGVSDAGDTPELTLFTPAADVELLFHGRTLCMDGLPINPGGIPTPATLTMAALGLSGMAVHVLNGGTKVKPHVPFYDMGGECGQDIRNGRALNNVRQSYEKGVMLGEMFSRDHDFLIASESCAGGTTTALAVMMAMGVLKENLVSSSSPKNPRELKSKIVSEALQAAGIELGGMSDRPLQAMECVGDPTMPANVGLVVGAARKIPVILG
ncbi:MAG: nicotinate-nucleotide--dimethylbenzimidazole phosphoribosyltransferase, partial [Candidatus Methanomethylophilaceae archaeon]